VVHLRVQAALCCCTAGEEECIDVRDASVAVHDDRTEQRPADDIRVFKSLSTSSVLSYQRTVKCYEVGAMLESRYAFRQVLLELSRCGMPWSEHARTLSGAIRVTQRCIGLTLIRARGSIRGRITVERVRGTDAVAQS
jgi:hypothetical protein